MGLIAIDMSGPTTAEVPPDAWLGGIPGLQALREPTPRLDLTPRPVVQRGPPRAWRRTLGRNAVPAAATLMIHVAFAAAFVFLLHFRDPDPIRGDEVEIPVDVVASVPEARETAPAPKPAAPEPPKPAAPKPAAPEALAPTPPEPPKPAAPDALKQALAMPVAPDPNPAALPALQPPAPPPGAAEAPKLVAPPPEPSRAATQDRDTKAANLAPEADPVDQATREAKPAEVPHTLTTTDPAAGFAVPAEAAPPPKPVDKPAPDIPAKAPSEADKLAAALPMDTNALPLSFRAVLSGSGAQVSAAYKGVVYGRFSRNAAIGERARQRHLKGQVVVAFSIDEAGRIKNLSVLASSGNPAVDALGLDMIRSAAPFPPPPPDAQRSFTPAFSFGE